MHEQRDPADRQSDSDDAAGHERESDERDASDPHERTPRATRCPDMPTDGDDVERLPLRGVRRVVVSVGMKSTRPSRSERYAGRTSAWTGHAR